MLVMWNNIPMHIPGLFQKERYHGGSFLRTRVCSCRQLTGLMVATTPELSRLLGSWRYFKHPLTSHLFQSPTISLRFGIRETTHGKKTVDTLQFECAWTGIKRMHIPSKIGSTDKQKNALSSHMRACIHDIPFNVLDYDGISYILSVWMYKPA